MRVVACLLSLLLPTLAWGQQHRFSDATYIAWAADADGRPCESQLSGFFRGSYSGNVLYPAAAAEGLVSGDVLLTFDTQYADGQLTIANARVFAAEPVGVFDEAALIVAQHFRFPPEMRACEGLRAQIAFRVNNLNADRMMRAFVASARATPPRGAAATAALRDFRLGRHCGVDGALNPEQLGEALEALYPENALSREIEGYAVVQLSIGLDGAVHSPTLLEEVPRGFGFGEAALAAIHVARYPVRETECEGAATVVHFRLR